MSKNTLLIHTFACPEELRIWNTILTHLFSKNSDDILYRNTLNWSFL
jgi:hypothetical protein